MSKRENIFLLKCTFYFPERSSNNAALRSKVKRKWHKCLKSKENTKQKEGNPNKLNINKNVTIINFCILSH